MSDKPKLEMVGDEIYAGIFNDEESIRCVENSMVISFSSKEELNKAYKSGIIEFSTES